MDGTPVPAESLTFGSSLGGSSGELHHHEYGGWSSPPRRRVLSGRPMSAPAAGRRVPRTGGARGVKTVKKETADEEKVP